jgi:hypothetical protein
MDRDRIMRRALWTSVPFNLGGALAFAFPGSLGRLVGLPAAAPPVYTASLAFLVALFAGTYAWLARQPRIDRPLVGFAVAGKSGFFLVILALWLGGEVSTLFLLGASGDLLLAAVFAWWLLGAPAAATASAWPDATHRAAAAGESAAPPRR